MCNDRIWVTIKLWDIIPSFQQVFIIYLHDLSVESPDELYERLIKNGKGTSLNGVTKKAMGKGLGSNLSKVLLGIERGFKILPDNGAKMLSHNLCIGKIPTQSTKV
jgi:hypothetical protein